MLRRLSLVLVLATASFGLSTAASAAPLNCPDASSSQMTMSDGTKLAVGMRWPAAAEGQLPLLVMQSGWSSTWGQYETDSCWLADRGYAVVMYTARGFHDSSYEQRGSQGEIDVAGDRTVKDMSEVIDQALKLKFNVSGGTTTADPSKVGVIGISYGAGVGLMAASHDERIRAVAAFSPWQDLTQSMFPNRTRKLQAVSQLYLGGLLAGTPDSEFNDAAANLFANRNVAKVVAYGDRRGVKANIGQLNANKPAVFLYAGFDDGFFDPNQVRDLYSSLTGPKRIELSPGEHAQRVKGTTKSSQNEIWVRASDWMDHYLRGVENGIDKRPPVQTDPVGPAPAEEYASFAAEAPNRQLLNFGPRSSTGGGTLSESGQRSWRWKIRGGQSSAAENGLAIGFLTGILEQALDQKIIAMPWWYVNQSQAGIWTSAPYPQGIKLRGPVTLSGRWQTNRTDQATMVAYLYDRDPWGTIRLLTTAPWTDRAMINGVSKPFRFSLNDQAYDVPPGHSLTVVVDTKDWLYMDETPTGANLKFSATREQPWTLEIPYR